ncbi:hypothetical protein JRQ81_018685 [Phrynocephalus forsythii]|uniref:Interleukin-6 n=1 Tax=Phrynocephalus forsythii TaxID=171643 RepID=A0A9Q1AZL0_9SAUR|nr:hypothetical protein JRQ81_018685 [Phrynocephalus forsythii]
MSVLLSACCFWAAAALMMSSGARGFPLGDSSGDEEFSDDPCARPAPVGGSLCLALELQRKAASWNAKETCLRKLSSGLYAFQTFLEYIEETCMEVHNTASILPETQRLADNLQLMMNSPDTVTMPLPEIQKVISAKLREQRGWNATVIKHLILKEFTAFMEKTTRAIRCL